MAEKKPAVRIPPELLYTGREGYIFISYAHKDTARVLPIIESLYTAGYRVWFDQGLEVGTEWMNTIASKVSGCALFLFVYSKNSAASTYCMDEIIFAKTKNKPGIVINLEDPSSAPSGVAMQTNRYAKYDAYDGKDDLSALLNAEELKPCYEGGHSRVDSSAPVKRRRIWPAAAAVLSAVVVLSAAALGIWKMGKASPAVEPGGKETTPEPFDPDEMEGTPELLYELSADGTCFNVTGYSGTSSYIEVPPTKKGLPVRLSQGAFADNWQIKDIIIYGDQDTVYPTMFSRCTKLESILFKGNVEAFVQENKDGKLYSFNHCECLKTLEFEGNVGLFGDISAEAADNSLIQDLPSLESLIIHGEIGTLASHAIDCSGLDNLVKVQLGTKIDTLQEASVIDNYNGQVQLPNELNHFSSQSLHCFTSTDYEGNKYYGNSENPYIVCCSQNGHIVNPKIPDGTKYIISWSDTAASMTVTDPSVLPNSIELMQGVRYDCGGNIVLPESLKRIDRSSFNFVSPVRQLIIPASVAEIEENALGVCCERISVNEGNTHFYVREDSLIERDTERLIQCFGDHLPEGIRSIDSAAFYSVKDTFKTLKIPEGITAFDCPDYKAFASIEIPASLSVWNNGLSHEISRWALSGFPYITISSENPYLEVWDDGTVYDTVRKTLIAAGKNNLIPEGTKKLGSFCFSDREIDHIVIPDSVTEFGNGVFSGAHLQSIVFPTSLTEIPDSMFAFLFSDEITIPEGIKRIGASAFYCSDIQKIVLPSTLEEIGAMAFGGCDFLKSISFPVSLKRIEEGAFHGCDSLSDVVIPEGLSFIGPGAFSLCVSLKSISFPASLKQIDNHAFAGSGLETVVLNAGLEDLGTGAFAECADLKTADLSLTALTGVGQSIFIDCTNLNTVTFPVSLTFIAYDAFRNTALTSIDLTNIERICPGAFVDTGITDVILSADIPEIYTEAFNEGCTLKCRFSYYQYAIKYAGHTQSSDMDALERRYHMVWDYED